MTVRNACRHFIPVRTPALLDLMRRDLASGGPEALARVATLLHEAYQVRFHTHLRRLKDAYAPFDPDSDDSASRYTAAERTTKFNELQGELRSVLGRAHFRHLGRDEISQALSDATHWGINMRVDFSLFESVSLFVRGESHQVRTYKGLWSLFREEEHEVPIYRRLILALKLRPNPKMPPGVSSDHVYLKIFKDIPRADVDMLLPGGRVKLRWLDQGKIGVGLLSGVGTVAYRLLHDLAAFLQNVEMASIGVLAGLAGYGSKSYFDYRNTQQAYHLNLTQSLYFQNLDSNAGVLIRLLDEAEEQQARNALVAYFCLWRYGENGMTADDLEGAIGLFLDRYAECPFVCEPGDPTNRLMRLGLAAETGGEFRALTPAEAISRLEHLREHPDIDILDPEGAGKRTADVRRKTS